MEIQEVFGWVKTLLTEIGVWDTLGTIIQVGLLVSATTFAIRVLRG